MKYALILGDGMADRPLAELGDKTPLEVSNKPYMDLLAKTAKEGMVKTIPEGFKPASDTANLSVLGYAPEKYYTGRSPLEAVSLGIKMADDDIAIRCNLVTLSNEKNYQDKTMVDYSAGEISTKEADELIKYVEANLGTEDFHFYSGISYRHCLIVKHTTTGTDFTPPHDISGKVISEYLPKDKDAEFYRALQEKSYELLKDHPVNLKRIKEGKNPANSIWLWGEGTKPLLDNFEQKFGKKGAMVCAVDLLKGIAISAGLKLYEVEGATGGVVTNFLGKGETALKALLDGNDFVYVHIEAPDESGHQGNVKAKINAIEQIDQNIVGTLFNGLTKAKEDFAIMVLPDHPTPIATKTHAKEPVPFMIYSSTRDLGANESYSEKDAEKTGYFIPVGSDLIKEFLSVK